MRKKELNYLRQYHHKMVASTLEVEKGQECLSPAVAVCTYCPTVDLIKEAIIALAQGKMHNQFNKSDVLCNTYKIIKNNKGIGIKIKMKNKKKIKRWPCVFSRFSQFVGEVVQQVSVVPHAPALVLMSCTHPGRQRSV